MSATTTPLPTGTDIAETIGGKVYNRAILFDQAGSPAQMYPDTQPVSAESLPLPEGAASEETLAAVSAKFPASLGAKAANASFSIVPATGASFAITAEALPATLGAKAAAASLSIVPATDASFSISADALPLPTGAATAAKQDEATAAIEALRTSGAPFPITPHASDPLERETAAISVVTGGTIVFRFPGAGSDETIEVPAGFFPLVASHIRDTSTASGLTGW